MTILSGDLKRDDTTVGTDDNAFHVVQANNVDSNGLIDGFTIEAGSADSTFPLVTNAFGGGILVQGGALTVRDCRFHVNNGLIGGGGFVKDAAGASFLKCRFENDYAGSDAPGDGGGGLAAQNAYPVREGLFLRRQRDRE